MPDWHDSSDNLGGGWNWPQSQVRTRPPTVAPTSFNILRSDPPTRSPTIPAKLTRWPTPRPSPASRSPTSETSKSYGFTTSPTPTTTLYVRATPSPTYGWSQNEDENATVPPMVVILIFLFFSWACVCISYCYSRRERQAIVSRSQGTAQATTRQRSVVAGNDTTSKELRKQVLHAMFPDQRVVMSQSEFDATSVHWSQEGDDCGTSSCAICLDRFQEGDTMVAGTCGHGFHKGCVMVWMAIKDDCPLCRQSMWDRDTYDALEQDIKANGDQVLMLT